MAKISLRLDDDLAEAAKQAGDGNLTAYITRAIRHELVRDELANWHSDPRFLSALDAADAELAAEHESLAETDR